MSVIKSLKLGEHYSNIDNRPATQIAIKVDLSVILWMKGNLRLKGEIPNHKSVKEDLEIVSSKPYHSVSNQCTSSTGPEGTATDKRQSRIP